jgi:hypothetical protein
MRKLSRKKKLVFTLLSLLLFLGIAEVGLRVFDFTRGASSHARTYWFWGFEQDRFLGYRPRASLDLTMPDGNKLDTNSEGFRDEEVPIVPTHPRRLIICMGESSN